MDSALADLIAEFWESPLVIEAARAVLNPPRPDPAPWARLLEGMVL